MRVAALVTAGCLAACQTPNIHVIVQGSDLELTVSPSKIAAAVYGDEQRTDFTYTKTLEAGRLGDLPATDFVLTGEATAPLQLRVAVPTATATWFADAILDTDTPSELRLPLSPSERVVTNSTTLGGQSADSSVLYGPGIVLAWVDSMGVQFRVERDPDSLIARTLLVENDGMASGVRLASRPDPLGFGPDLYAIGWLSGTREPRVRVTSNGVDRAIATLGASVVADELRIGAAFKNASFAIAVAVRVGATIQLTTLSSLGVPIATVTLANDVDALSGIVVTLDGNIVIAWRGPGGSRFMLLDGDLTGGATTLVQQQTADEVLAISLSPDGGRLFSIQQRGAAIANVGYFVSNLQPTGLDVALGTTVSGGDVAVSGCLVVWPTRRDDGGGATDLRFALVNADGALDGVTHVLNVSETGDHIRPSAVCASPTRAYATFIERADAGDPNGRLRLRRIPAIDP